MHLFLKPLARILSRVGTLGGSYEELLITYVDFAWSELEVLKRMVMLSEFLTHLLPLGLRKLYVKLKT